MSDHSRIFLSPPHMGGHEQALIAEAFATNYIAPLGPMVDRFETNFAALTGIPYCLALTSGTAAIHLALRVLGVGPGDTVFASSLTAASRPCFIRARRPFSSVPTAEAGRWMQIC
jgi:dTDP-4-amino-4,6-dideoxygalactose transaminase